MKKTNISEFAGAWSDMSEADADELKEDIGKIRADIHKGLMKKISKVLP